MIFSFWINGTVGLGLGLALALWGWRSGWFTWWGGLLGGLSVLSVSLLGNWTWTLPVAAFLISLIVLAGFRADFKRSLSDRFRQGARRDWQQILARLLWPIIMALFSRMIMLPELTFFAFIGALGTSTADLWQTELGVLGDAEPRLLIDGRRVPPGRQGGVSLLGTLAGVAGAWLVGFLGLLGRWFQVWMMRLPLSRVYLWLPFVTLLAGLVGSLVDTLLAAVAQGVYYCEHCDERTEHARHYCGHQATQIRGASWLTNDVINLVATVVGAGIGGALAGWLAQSLTRW